MSTSRRAVAGLVLALLVAPSVARAQDTCSRVVVFTLPGITWEHITRYEPPAILEAIDDGAAGSVSVRTNSARTSYASGFATLGAGTRVDGGDTTGGSVDEAAGVAPEGLFASDVDVAGQVELRELADRAGYNAVPGALATALAGIPITAVGNADLAVPLPAGARPGRWTLLAAMDSSGVVDRAAVDPSLLEIDPGAVPRTDPVAFEAAIDGALATDCGVTIVDHGDPTRADQVPLVPGATLEEGRAVALDAADDALGKIGSRLDPERDLLLIVSPTSPLHDDATHFGIAVAVGPGFTPGTQLTSAVTRRAGIVTLPDIAPTLLTHLDIARPPAMLGRPITTVTSVADSRIAHALELDRESMFVDDVRAPIWTGFVVAQLLVYGAIAMLLWRGRDVARERGARTRWLEAAAFALLAFPVATFLIGSVSGHRLGVVGYVALLIAIDVAVVVGASMLTNDARGRLLFIAGTTSVVLLGDLVLGSKLQLNTVFSYSPIVAGRFTGIGNIGFALLGAAVIVTAGLLVDRWGRSPRVLVAAATLFVATVVIDGAPGFGSDVGGVLAFVPTFLITWFLIAGKRPSARLVLIALGATLAALALFLAWDLSLPESSRTHLGRFFEDVRARGLDVFGETIARKIRANLRVFTSTIWTYLVPPLLVFVGWLLSSPPGRWPALAERLPALRAAILGGLVLSVLGFAVNDSGIVVPAVVLSMLVPVALVMHLRLERERSA